MSTKIEWVKNADGTQGVTVNPFPGCKKVSEGCHNCYAEKMAKRLKGMNQNKYACVVDDGGWTGEVGYDPHCTTVPGKGKMVFVNSMGDIGHASIPQAQFNEVMDRMQAQPSHTFQVLTKRPEELAKKLDTWVQRYDPQVYEGRALRCVFPKLWFGVTCENQEWADTRIPILLQIPAAVRWVSLEPLLGPVDLTRVNVNHLPGCRGCVANVLDSRDGPLGEPYKHLNWVVCGAETGPGRRWCDTRWVESVVRQCHAAKVPVFVKKLHKPIPGKLPKIVDDINEISNMLGYSPEQLRQWPGKEQP